MYEYSFSIFVALNYNHALMTRSHYSALSLSFEKQKMQLILTSLLSQFCYLFQRQVGIFMTLKLLSQATKSKILLLNFLSDSSLVRAQDDHHHPLSLGRITWKKGSGQGWRKEEKFYARFVLRSITPVSLSWKLRCSLINKFCHFTCGSTTFWRRRKSAYANFSDT